MASTMQWEKKMEELVEDVRNHMNETKAALDRAVAEIERQKVSLCQQHEAYNKEKSLVEKMATLASPIVHLNVGGEKMSTSRATLTLIEGTTLATMFSGNWEDKLIKDGDAYFLDFDPTLFKHLINNLRTWSMNPSTPRTFRLPVGCEQAFIDFVKLLNFDEKLLALLQFANTGGPGIQLLDKNFVCEKFSDNTQWAYALGTCTYVSGLNVVRMKVEKSQGWTLMGIISQNATPKVPTYYNTPSAYGWFIENQIYASGNCTNKKWTSFVSNDIFKLEINCDGRILKILNERTQEQDELRVDINQAPLPWRLLVIVYNNEDRVRLL